MTIRELTEEIQTTKNLKDIAQSYTEISSLRLKKIRKKTEQSRVFFQDLAYIFGLLHHMAEVRKLKNKLIPIKPPKEVVILITSNFRFYGRISNSATQLFMKYTEKHHADQIVIGKLGADLLRSRRYSQPYKLIKLQKDIPNHEEMLNLTELIKNYTSVILIYSEFRTILSQVPVIKDLTQTQIQASQSQFKKMDYAFILEPEIKTMIDFFDTQIKNVLLSAAFLETELARVASRLLAMDQAQNNAKSLLKKEAQQLIFAKRALFNKKTLETWISIIAHVGFQDEARSHYGR